MRRFTDALGGALRLILIALMISMPVAAPLAVFGFYWLAGFAAVGVALIFLGLGFRSESILVHQLKAWVPESSGFQKSLAFIQGEKRLLARVAIYPELAAQVTVARSWGSRGTVFLSKGLVSLLNEEELRSVIRMADHALRAGAVPRVTLAALLSSWAWRLSPISWRSLFFGNSAVGRPEGLWPLGFLGFVLIYPICQFLWSVGSVEYQGEAFLPATVRGKLGQSRRIWSGSLGEVSLAPLSLFRSEPGALIEIQA